MSTAGIDTPSAAPAAAVLANSGLACELPLGATEHTSTLIAKPSEAVHAAVEAQDGDSGSQATDMRLAAHEELGLQVKPMVMAETSAATTADLSSGQEERAASEDAASSEKPDDLGRVDSEVPMMSKVPNVAGARIGHLRVVPMPVPEQNGPIVPASLPLNHCYWSKKQSQVALSPTRLLHIPRTMIEESMDLKSILENGINIQIEANGVLEPVMINASIGMYKNSTGHTYYRILGFKPVCRKYQEWVLLCWSPVNATTVRMCICKAEKPASPPPAAKTARPAKAGQKRNFDNMAGSDQSAPASPIRLPPTAWDAIGPAAAVVQGNAAGLPMTSSPQVGLGNLSAQASPVFENNNGFSSFPAQVVNQQSSPTVPGLVMPSWAANFSRAAESNLVAAPVANGMGWGHQLAQHVQADGYANGRPLTPTLPVVQPMPGLEQMYASNTLQLQAQPAPVMMQMPAGYMLGSQPHRVADQQLVIMQDDQQQHMLVLLTAGNGNTFQAGQMVPVSMGNMTRAANHTYLPAAASTQQVMMNAAPCYSQPIANPYLM